LSKANRQKLMKIRREAQRESGVKMTSMSVSTSARKEKVVQQLKVFREQAKMLRRARQNVAVEVERDPLPPGRANPSVGADWDQVMEDMYHNAMDEL